MIRNMNEVASLITDWDAESQDAYIRMQVQLVELYNATINVLCLCEDVCEAEEIINKALAAGKAVYHNFEQDAAVSIHILRMFSTVLEFTVMNVKKGVKEKFQAE